MFSWQTWWWSQWPEGSHDYYGRLLYQRVWIAGYFPDYYGNCTYMRCAACQLAYDMVALLQDQGYPVAWQEWDE